jgi:26S proteasome regulatory subunit N12
MNMEALELGVLLHVAAGDLDGFARNYAQLQPLLLSGQEDSQRTCLLLGLNLMCLLVENRLSEFHAEMELLTNEQASNAYISFPITLERQLMVGSYDEVLKAHLHIPDKSYAFFMDNLTLTVKDSIADCIEVSYQKMKLKDAMTMMKFATQDELLDYVKEARDDWIVVDGEFLEFQPPPTKRQASDIPSKTLISQSLAYATELERII